MRTKESSCCVVVCIDHTRGGLIAWLKIKYGTIALFNVCLFIVWFFCCSFLSDIVLLQVQQLVKLQCRLCVGEGRAGLFRYTYSAYKVVTNARLENPQRVEIYSSLHKSPTQPYSLSPLNAPPLPSGARCLTTQRTSVLEGRDLKIRRQR